MTTTTRLNPTGFTLHNNAAEPNYATTVVGEGNVLNDGLDTTYLLFVDQHGTFTEEQRAWAAVTFDGSFLPPGEVITKAIITYRYAGDSLNYAYLDLRAMLDGETWTTRTLTSSTLFGNGNPDVPSSSTFGLTTDNYPHLANGTFALAFSGYKSSSYAGRKFRLIDLWIDVTHGVPPANDNSADAVPISGSAGSIAGDLTNASVEAGEGDANESPASVWYSWTVPADWDPAKIAMISALPDAPMTSTVVGVYRGGIASSNRIAAGLGSYGERSLARARVQPGETLLIKVGSYYGGATSTFLLSWDVGLAAATNDEFANRQAIVLDEAVTGNIHASTPDQAWDSLAVGGSHWYEFISDGSPIKLHCVADQVYVDLYQATDEPPTIDMLNYIDGWWFDPTDPTTVTIWKPPAGKLVFEIYDYGHRSPESENSFTLSVQTGPPKRVPPPNDDFANRITLQSAHIGPVTLDLSEATRESGEPNMYAETKRTAWYEWVCPAGLNNTYQEFTATAIGDLNSSPYMIIAIYTGTDVTALTLNGQRGGYNSATVSIRVSIDQTYKIAVSEYFGTEYPLEVNVSYPRGGVLEVNDGTTGFRKLCNCPDPVNWEITETQTKTYGGAYLYGGAEWTNGPQGQDFIPGGTKLLESEPPTADWAIGGTTSMWWGNGIWSKAEYPTYDPATDSGYATLDTTLANTNGTRPTLIRADFPVPPHDTDWKTPKPPPYQTGRVKTVTIRALLKTSEHGVNIGVHPAGSNPATGLQKYQEIVGVGGRFISTAATPQWVEQTFSMEHRSDADREAIGAGLGDTPNTHVFAWAPANTGIHTIYELRVTVTTDAPVKVAGRMKLNAGTEEAPKWYIQRCCKDTTTGRPLKVKAGEGDWRKSICFIRQPGPWVQLPEFENVFSLSHTSAGPVHHPQNFAEPLRYNDTDDDVWVGSIMSWLTRFNGRMALDRGPGGPEPSTEYSALECCWHYARRFNGPSLKYWIGEGGTLENPNYPPVCPTYANVVANGSSNHIRTGYVNFYEGATFGIGFGTSIEVRVEGVTQAFRIGYTERLQSWAQPVTMAGPAPEPGAYLEWDDHECTVTAVWLAPDECETEQPTPGLPTRWYYGAMSSTPPLWAPWNANSSTAPEDLASWGTYLGTYSSGLSEWTQVPDPVLAAARAYETANPGTNGGLMMVNLPDAAFSDTPPANLSPHNETRGFNKYRQSCAVKVRVKPARYRWRYLP